MREVSFFVILPLNKEKGKDLLSTRFFGPFGLRMTI
jgi:hypothetical protein